MGKLLDLTDRLNQRRSENPKKNTKAEVVDMTEARQAILNREKRQVKRTLLTEFIGAFTVLPERGLLRVSLYDISDNGCAFDVEMMEGNFRNGDEVAMRVYMNHKTYFSFVVKITHTRPLPVEGVVRHGANFVKGTLNDVALHHFVKFIETVSASLKTDDGDIQVSNIS